MSSSDSLIYFYFLNFHKGLEEKAQPFLPGLSPLGLESINAVKTKRLEDVNIKIE